jgi:hypothetical protein
MLPEQLQSADSVQPELTVVRVHTELIKSSTIDFRLLSFEQAPYNDSKQLVSTDFQSISQCFSARAFNQSFRESPQTLRQSGFNRFTLVT